MKLKKVFSNRFVEKQKNDKLKFADFTYENANDFITSSYVLKKVDKEEIVEAVSVLLGNKQSQ